MRKSVDLTENGDGTWTARIYGTTYTGTRAQCVAWLHANGEQW
jgi:hypothetical protein